PRERRAAAAALGERGHSVDRLTDVLRDAIELPAGDPVGGRHPAAADGDDILHRQILREGRARNSTAWIEFNAVERSREQLQIIESAECRNRPELHQIES